MFSSSGARQGRVVITGESLDRKAMWIPDTGVYGTKSHECMHGIADMRPIANERRPYQDRVDARVQMVGTVEGPGQIVVWSCLSLG